MNQCPENVAFLAQRILKELVKNKHFLFYLCFKQKFQKLLDFFKAAYVKTLRCSNLSFSTHYLSCQNQSDRSNRNLCNLVNNLTLGYVVCTIVPRHNQREAYKNVSCTALGPPGRPIFLCEVDNSSKYNAKLHI